MFYHLAAVAVLGVHMLFILFVVLGAFLGLRWKPVLALHLPAAAWATSIELAPRNCPLTLLENHFRILAGLRGYSDGFVEHYLLAAIYPGGVTRGVQLGLAGLVVGVNLGIYGWLVCRLLTSPGSR